MLENLRPTSVDADIAALAESTPLIDTHEHLVEEEIRLNFTPGSILRCNDWTLLFSHYLNEDLVVAGMAECDLERFFSPEIDPTEKWSILKPWWPFVKNTGYGLATRIAMERLYGIGEICAGTIEKLQSGYSQFVKPGFYRKVLTDMAGIESCQVNSLVNNFSESQQPTLMMQDLSIFRLHLGPDWRANSEGSYLPVNDLADYHRVLDWWFDRYASYAVAVKTQAAYARALDFADVPAETASPVFNRMLNGDAVLSSERKLVEDHLFWECIRRATSRNLSVKIHTGYCAGYGSMNLSAVASHPSDIAEILRHSPETQFVLMHIGYPFQEQMIALAKHYQNAFIDMCWAWIISPTASCRFLKDMLVAAPASKVLVFGGDYIPVEPVVGHAEIARMGVSRALTELVGEGWMQKTDALDLVGMLMNGNARRLFNLEEKRRNLANAPWLHG